MGLFKQSIQLLQQINEKNWVHPVYGAKFEPLTSCHESSPITTGQGSRPNIQDFESYWVFLFKFCSNCPGWLEGHLQCDQTSRLFFNLWPFTTIQIYQVLKKLPKYVQTFAKYLINHTKMVQRLLIFCQRVEFTPNLVTLVTRLYCIKTDLWLSW